MSEVRTGLRGLLANPTVYEGLQWLLQADRGRRKFVENHVRPSPGKCILEVGCGPGELLRYMPDVTYVGFDPNPSYIERAKRTFGDRGAFFAKRYEEADVECQSSF